MLLLGMDSVVRASLEPSRDHPGVAFGVCSVGVGVAVGYGSYEPLLVHYVNKLLLDGLGWLRLGRARPSLGL